AFAAGKPLVGVSALDALARIAEAEAAGRRIATWVDAWRGEVYAALYQNGHEIQSPVVASPGEVLTRIGSEPALFVGDGARTYQASTRKTGETASISDVPTPLLAGTIAILGGARAAGGLYSPAHAIRPLYVRRTDAELARVA